MSESVRIRVHQRPVGFKVVELPGKSHSQRGAIKQHWVGLRRLWLQLS
jgi:hypothetical protein